MSEDIPAGAPAASASVAAAADQELPFRYDARLAAQIERYWQQRWDAQETFRVPNPASTQAADTAGTPGGGGPKFYVLDMFPYPSGAGLHVGHPLGYIATDVYARFLRMTGHRVLHALGYDAFGLPAEQYAIDTGQHPAVTTRNNVATMRRQLRRLGLGHDPSREIVTSDPGFYRWTQWIFLQIFNSWFDEDQGRARPVTDLIAEFESGKRAPAGEASPDGRPWADLDPVTRRRLVDGMRLAYISEELVNWCPGLGTVLANEEVTAEGRSDVGNYPVVRRPLRQWMLRITAYAERLLADLEPLDWPEPIKRMQRNWIGPSDGASVTFPVAAGSGGGARPGAAGPATIAVFTTRPDTLPGATYLVLAPEHPAVDSLVAVSWPADTPLAWRFPDGQRAAGGPGESRHEEGRDGGRSPAAAVRAYRAHAASMTDRERTVGGAKTGVFTGSYAVSPVTGARIPVFVADYVLMGYGTGAIMAVPAHDDRDLAFARRFGLPVTAVLQPPASWFTEHGVPDGAPAGTWSAAFTGEGPYTGWAEAGVELTGLGQQQACDAVTGWLERAGYGRRQRSYRLRDWLFSRQRYWGEPFPIVYDADGLPVALPERLLPVTLPDMTDFRTRTQDGSAAQGPAEHSAADLPPEPVPPLARAPGWADVELDLGEGPRSYRRELNTMPQWAGSCWYYLRYLDPGNQAAFVDPAVERYWMVPDGAAPGDGGVDLYVGGAEHAVLHLLYARFWHKVLYDLGHVSTREPFRWLPWRGYILADAFIDARGRYVPAAEVEQRADGRWARGGEPVRRRIGKMGKSLKNGINPDDIYDSYGADTLRLYEMAMGPLDADRPWHTDDIVGVHRFLQRLWRAIIDERTGELIVDDAPLNSGTTRRLHQTIGAVRGHFAALRFNLAVARLQELNTHAARIAAARGALPRAIAEPLVLMVAPLAPHIAEELWARLGHRESLAYAAFPVADERLAAEPALVLPVQVNGRTRFRIEVPADAAEEQITEILGSHPGFARHVGDAPVQRLVVVPGRIVNVVTGRRPPI